MYLPELRDVLSQGDVFVRLPTTTLATGTATQVEVTGAVLSHDCDIQPGQKASLHHALLVEFRSPGELTGGQWGSVMAGRTWNGLYVPASGQMPEGFFDFNRIHQVPRAELYQAQGDGRRIASMTDEGRERLVYMLMSQLLREELVPRGRHG